VSGPLRLSHHGPAHTDVFLDYLPKSVRGKNGKLLPLPLAPFGEGETIIVANPTLCAMQQCLSRSYSLPCQAPLGDDCPKEDGNVYHDPSICDCASGSPDSQAHAEILNAIGKIEGLSDKLRASPHVRTEHAVQCKSANKIDVSEK
jgi:hypothetical protein